MKELLQAGHSGRVSAPPEKRFLIRFHPLLAAKGWGGGVIGPVMLAGAWTLAYAMLLLALRRCRNLESDE